eukprot:CAMPEP_0113938888 /NCGR_PEP_ID=MMETSP1339-20121228/5300_1 /TAXON_ID=94617 /ORGANISM="Fibrocapsa japonica" /LENGTH=422 /DNA_ID=CAMNT_0000942211 /DNA_START=146 /DNA_END=1414 /DNA_ORIENTATION=+ /assembly_acc=CAM_ASM_000762
MSGGNGFDFSKNINDAFKSAVVGFALGSAVLFAPITPINPAIAADTVTVGKCLLNSCQKELAQCVLNPKCFANIICLQTCNNRPDEAECQIKCGDLFENDVVGKFNACAVTKKKCVPQKQDEGLYPIPSLESQVKKFDTKIWDGRWYISAGLNKAFDTFDCQVHFFDSPQPGLFYAKINWRISEPDGEFFTKNVVQRFVQDKKNPAHLINHDNEYLNYKDDWYVLDYEPDNFVLVYYKGSNDAWDGYGGAFLYTRSSTVPEAIVPRLEAAMAKSETPYKWSDFTLTDNTCKEQTESALVLREKFAQKLIIQEEEQLVEALTSVRQNAINTLIKDEKFLEQSVLKLEKQIEAFRDEIALEVVALESEIGKDLMLIEKEIEKDIVGIEKEIEKDIIGIEKEIEKDIIGIEKEIEKDVKGLFQKK